MVKESWKLKLVELVINSTKRKRFKWDKMDEGCFKIEFRLYDEHIKLYYVVHNLEDYNTLLTVSRKDKNGHTLEDTIQIPEKYVMELNALIDYKPKEFTFEDLIDIWYKNDSSE